MTEIAARLATMRATAPLVQNITNYVAMNVMANVMLAAGASPAMVHAEEEAAEFAGFTQALTINIGTLSGPWVAAMEAAATAASERGTPWVLDPVAVGATAFRREVGARLVAMKPAVVRAMPRKSWRLRATRDAARAWTAPMASRPPRMPRGGWRG